MYLLFFMFIIWERLLISYFMCSYFIIFQIVVYIYIKFAIHLISFLLLFFKEYYHNFIVYHNRRMSLSIFRVFLLHLLLYSVCVCVCYRNTHSVDGKRRIRRVATINIYFVCVCWVAKTKITIISYFFISGLLLTIVIASFFRLCVNTEF